MKIIKISTGDSRKKILQRQIPGGRYRWGDCEFHIDTKLKVCDWWFICHVGGLRAVEKITCDPDKIVYLSMEPNEKIAGTQDQFLKQFGLIVSCDENIRFDNIIYKNIHTWWVGLSVDISKGKHIFSKKYNLDYSSIADDVNKKKINRISVIMSSRSTLKGHKARDNFIERIKTHKISKYVDIYGRGFKEFEDKWDVIQPYKYHLVIENCSKKYYWSEKLADAYLGGAYPIYYGCSNIHDYFNKEMLALIDIENIDSALDKMLDIIEDDTFEKNKLSIAKAKKYILDKYNIFNEISMICNIPSSNKKKNKLLPNYYFIDGFIRRSIKNLVNSLIKF